MSPLVGRSSAPSRLSSVDLPLPLGPMIARYSPRWMVSETSTSAETSPSSYVRLTLATCRSGSSAVGGFDLGGCNRTLLMAEGVYGGNARRVERRVQRACDAGDQRGRQTNRNGRVRHALRYEQASP